MSEDLVAAEAFELRLWVAARTDIELVEWLHRVTEQQMELAELRRTVDDDTG